MIFLDRRFVIVLASVPPADTAAGTRGSMDMAVIPSLTTAPESGQIPLISRNRVPTHAQQSFSIPQILHFAIKAAFSRSLPVHFLQEPAY